MLWYNERESRGRKNKFQAMVNNKALLLYTNFVLCSEWVKWEVSKPCEFVFAQSFSFKMAIGSKK